MMHRPFKLIPTAFWRAGRQHATGSRTGIVSGVILESDHLDEADWELLGSYTTKFQTEYFSKEDSGSYSRWNQGNIASPKLLSTIVVTSENVETLAEIKDGRGEEDRRASDA
ncbi:hypothetical protein N7510_000996 [Penicillium lagena]|uniref:uncharacterized protein n=1 Tax=Penicillium lagena TaxID=94218 RepID=UPI002541D5FA|nr:uncharacterized protein N7510_000996 [Penicillium lagena]KAJ5624687.1 hypothetical protein N7510_000996 [Penicillium lagena]